MARDSTVETQNIQRPVQPEELATPWQVVKHPFWDAKRWISDGISVGGPRWQPSFFKGLAALFVAGKPLPVVEMVEKWLKLEWILAFVDSGAESFRLAWGADNEFAGDACYVFCNNMQRTTPCLSFFSLSTLQLSWPCPPHVTAVMSQATPGEPVDKAAAELLLQPHPIVIIVAESWKGRHIFKLWCFGLVDSWTQGPKCWRRLKTNKSNKDVK